MRSAPRGLAPYGLRTTTRRLPISPHAFEIGGILPAMLYMARCGHRRGRGRFVETFRRTADGHPLAPTIGDVAEGLLSRPASILEGFDAQAGRSVLGDLLLVWCLENRKHREGHSEPIQRIYPTHYLASWVDLPSSVVHLRGVPELLTALLANQDSGDWIEVRGRGRFPVGVSHAENRLLALFARHTEDSGLRGVNDRPDTFVEAAAQDIGIDELLAIRMALACERAPSKARGRDESERIPNRSPVARQAGDVLRNDLSVFIEVYGTQIPRQAFLQMLESGIGIGLTNLLFSTAGVLAEWERTGVIAAPGQQSSCPLFVDASQGQDKMLRDLSEASMTECLRRYERMPIHMMLLRVLDDRVRTDRKLHNQLPAASPDATHFIDLLGEIYQGRHPRAEALLDAFHEDCQRLADSLEAEGEYQEVAQRLRSGNANPALRLAEGMCELMGDKLQRTEFMVVLESALMTDQPNGLALKRRVRRQQGSQRRSQDLRSIVLTPALLDFLVHRYLRKAAKGKPFRPLSLPDFLALLRERYGLHVDRQLPGQPISQDVLLRNKAWLERKLRDLGLLIGVNDAESMKQLRPRYQVELGDAV